MIFDKLENIQAYVNTHPRFKVAFDWLQKTDMDKLPVGEKIPLDGDNIFAKLMEVDTFPSHKKTFEGHHKYIDIQMVIVGIEAMEVALLEGDEEEAVPYTEAKESYKVQTQQDALVVLKNNDFVIFFPQDLHKPCINHGHRSEYVKKVVVKVLVD